jgi:oligopeptidase A
MLTQVNERDVSGISGVEWDAVELPSQFMENFCWEWNVLRHMTAHVDTGAPLPRALFDKMLAAKNFQSGMQTLRQIEFALFDMLLHTEPRPGAISCPAAAGARRSGRHQAARLQPHGPHLQPYLCRRLRGGLLQLQMGRGAERRRLCRL